MNFAIRWRLMKTQRYLSAWIYRNADEMAITLIAMLAGFVWFVIVYGTTFMALKGAR
jgi:hypothetical protein